MAANRQQLGDNVVTQGIRTGSIDSILARQKEMIWDLVCLLEMEKRLIKATGEPLNPRYLRDHLERRYLDSEDRGVETGFFLHSFESCVLGSGPLPFPC
ncbi:carboxypeptidase, putative [Leishmania tarentolae]|uniref:Carboxypeptidase, putative n=1 Tax=Leishmania tarentolae TaxID=5689 RepID=A0A640KCY2_LEITA|nr:carboxypeptidase, putative [Leishmania tarentolae]